MTKEQEINALQDFTQSMPADSYIRPMLTLCLPRIIQDIRADLIPDPVMEIDAMRANLERTRREYSDEHDRLVKAVRKKESLAREIKAAERELDRMQNIAANIAHTIKLALI